METSRMRDNLHIGLLPLSDTTRSVSVGGGICDGRLTEITGRIYGRLQPRRQNKTTPGLLRASLLLYYSGPEGGGGIAPREGGKRRVISIKRSTEDTRAEAPGPAIR